MQFLSSSPHMRIREQYSRAAYLGLSSQNLNNSCGSAPSPSFKRQNAIRIWELGSIPISNLVRDSQMNGHEKEVLQEANDRLARFIEKVRCLENHNQHLEREIRDLRQKRQLSPLALKCEPVIRDLRKQAHGIAEQNRHTAIELDHLEQDLSSVRSKCEEEARYRANIERIIIAMQTHINDAALSKMELDKKAQSLVDELRVLKEKHKEDVLVIMGQIHEAQQCTEMKDLGTGDIASALRDIRMELEGRACSHIPQAEECLQNKMAKIMKAVEMNRKTLEIMKKEIAEHKKLFQTKSVGLQTLKGAKEALEKQLNALDEEHDAEVSQYQDTVRRLKQELSQCEHEMSAYCQQYQDLLNVKMALDVEIGSYRQLLEGEELRLHSCTQGPVPYIYRQSPVYTLPYFTIRRGHCYKVMPQFKFVEEIITETTREVELSETEETESDRSSSEAARADKSKGSTDGEGETTEDQVTMEEEEVAGSEEEGGEPAAEATNGAAAGEDGERALTGTQGQPPAEEDAEEKRPAAILRDQSTETEDMAIRNEDGNETRGNGGDSGESLMEKTPEHQSLATLKTKQRVTECHTGEKCLVSRSADSSVLIEGHSTERSHPSGPTMDKIHEKTDVGKNKIFIGGKELSGMTQCSIKEANGLYLVEESIQPDVEGLWRVDDENKASGVAVKPKEDPVKGTVHPTESPDQPRSTSVLSPQCEPDVPLSTITVKDIPDVSMGRLPKSEDKITPAGTAEGKSRMGIDSAKEESAVLINKESSGECKQKKINGDTMEDPGEKPQGRDIKA